jgi:hypothetical protein
MTTIGDPELLGFLWSPALDASSITLLSRAQSITGGKIHFMPSFIRKA